MRKMGQVRGFKLRGLEIGIMENVIFMSRKKMVVSNERSWPPHLSKLKRGPAVVLPKDAGAIIAIAGIGKKSKVLDAGAGSGWLAVQLGNVANEVISYENREEFAKLAEQNVRRAGLENVQVRMRNVLADGFDEKDADAVCLDFADSCKALAFAYSSLKEGGAVVGYLPHAEQLNAFVKEGNAQGFSSWYCIEVIVREMLAREAGVRPANVGLMHTGYLAFGRKIKA